MKCPTCVEEGEKSKIFPLGSSMTLMYCAPFYDEEGVYHHHDGNIITSEYRCSREHHWVEKRNPSCPAGDWPEPKEVEQV